MVNTAGQDSDVLWDGRTHPDRRRPWWRRGTPVAVSVTVVLAVVALAAVFLHRGATPPTAPVAAPVPSAHPPITSVDRQNTTRRSPHSSTTATAWTEW